jgi:hypothetical protein
MPRKSRIDAAGAIHHVMVRGIERGAVFRDDTDRNNFLERLGKILQDTKTICYAWSVREVKVPMSSLGGKLGISIPAVSDSVARGQRIAEAKGFRLMKT